MQITRNPMPHPFTRPLKTVAPASQESTPQAPADILDRLPSRWQDIDPDPVVLPQSAPPALPRPVIFLHGFNGSAERWENVFEWLTSGEEPVNKDGGIIDAGKFDNIDPEANLFSLRLSRPYNSVEKNKAELKATVEAVLKATGAEEVDLVVHSLGGLNARHYLQDDEEKVNKLVMLGTPNHGSQLANMERFFREKFDYPIFPPADDPEVRRVLEQLSVDKLDQNRQPTNPWLHALNDDWREHRENADIMIVAGAGIPTLTGGPGLTVFGDGVVTRNSARLSGIENKTAWFKTHGGIVNSSKVMENTANFLTGKELTPGENLFDTPEDAVRAAELVSSESRKADPRRDVGDAPIEKAQQAARLPILDPAFQFGMGLGVLSALMGGPKETLPLVEIAVNSRKGENKVQAHYDIDMERAENPLQGSGQVGDQPFAEVAHLHEGKVHWKSALGLESSGLVLEVGEDEQSVRMRGEVGGVNADLNLAMLKDDSGRMSGIKTTGSLNGQPYSLRSTIDVESLLSGSEHHTTMHVSGLVNEQVVEKNYQVDVHRRRQGGLELRAFTPNSEAGDQSVDVQVKIKDRT